MGYPSHAIITIRSARVDIGGVAAVIGVSTVVMGDKIVNKLHSSPDQSVTLG